MIDHRALMVKYMRLVREREGTMFNEELARARLREEGEEWIDRDDPETQAELAFTEDEWAELQRLANEVGPRPPLPAVHFRSLLTYETIRGETLPSTGGNHVVRYGTPPSDGLKPCRCGSTEVAIHRWRMGNGACYCCAKCGVGTPSGRIEDSAALIVNMDGDATEAARAAWNRWASA